MVRVVVRFYEFIEKSIRQLIIESKLQYNSKGNENNFSNPGHTIFHQSFIFIKLIKGKGNKREKAIENNSNASKLWRKKNM